MTRSPFITCPDCGKEFARHARLTGATIRALVAEAKAGAECDIRSRAVRDAYWRGYVESGLDRIAGELDGLCHNCAYARTALSSEPVRGEVVA